MTERQPNPYRGVLIGEKRRLSEIETKVPYVKPALDAFMDCGRIIGQKMLDGDTLLWSPEGLERKAREREKAEAGHRKKEVILMERYRQAPLQPEYRQTPLQGMGGEPASFSDLNKPTEYVGRRSAEMSHRITPDTIISTGPFVEGPRYDLLGVTGLEQTIFEADLENPMGHEGRGPRREPTDPIE